MNQFDVFRAPDGTLVCVLQHDFLLDRAMVMACMLTPTEDAAARGLTPVVMIDGRRHLLDVTLQVPIRAAQLRRRAPILSLADRREEILDALNMLYWGL